MSELKEGDRVSVVITGRKTFHGRIAGEASNKIWWLVARDEGGKVLRIHKSYCRPEVIDERA
jgi:hypothetical protein